MDGQKAVTPEVAERIRQGGLHVAPELIDPKADQTTDHVNFRKFNEQIDETRAELEPLIHLACPAQRSLTTRFGEGYHDQLDGGAPGRRQWLAGVRHRTSRQVNPHVGFMDALKPLNA